MGGGHLRRSKTEHSVPGRGTPLVLEIPDISKLSHFSCTDHLFVLSFYSFYVLIPDRESNRPPLLGAKSERIGESRKKQKRRTKKKTPCSALLCFEDFPGQFDGPSSATGSTSSPPPEELVKTAPWEGEPGGRGWVPRICVVHKAPG